MAEFKLTISPTTYPASDIDNANNLLSGRYLALDGDIETTILRIENILLRHNMLWDDNPHGGTIYSPTSGHVDVSGIKSEIAEAHKSINEIMIQLAEIRGEITDIRICSSPATRGKLDTLEERLDKIENDMRVNKFFIEGEVDEKD